MARATNPLRQVANGRRGAHLSSARGHVGGQVPHVALRGHGRHSSSRRRRRRRRLKSCVDELLVVLAIPRM